MGGKGAGNRFEPGKKVLTVSCRPDLKRRGGGCVRRMKGLSRKHQDGITRTISNSTKSSHCWVHWAKRPKSSVSMSW